MHRHRRGVRCWRRRPSHSCCWLAAAGIGAVLLDEVRDGLLVLAGLIPIVGADVATAYRSERGAR